MHKATDAARKNLLPAMMQIAFAGGSFLMSLFARMLRGFFNKPHLTKQSLFRHDISSRNDTEKCGNESERGRRGRSSFHMRL